MTTRRKEELARIIKEWDVPEELIPERDKLIKTILSNKIIIPDDQHAVNEFLENTLKYFFKKKFELNPPSETHKPSRKT